MTTSLGIIVARFQTPYLHQGHHSLIKEVSERHQRIVIVLGTQPVRGSVRNPYDYPTRQRMLQAAYPHVTVLPLADNPSDERWSEHLDTMLTNAFPGEGFRLYGSRDSFIPYYSGKYPTETLPEAGTICATEIRERYQDLVGDSEDFRKGILYAHSRLYPTTYATVDIALLNDDKVLLARKPEETSWRLPGGFTDPTDESYEAAALRELCEECGAIEATNFTYQASFKIEDWRYRRESSKIITLLFTADYKGGEIKAGDDINEARWFTLDEAADMLQHNKINKAHQPLLRKVLERRVELTPHLNLLPKGEEIIQE